MKLAVIFFCITAIAVSALDYRTKIINKFSSERRLFGILGGQEISIERRPYTVSLENSQKKYAGTGALLNNNWIITAAVNVINTEPSDIIVRVASSTAFTGGQTLQVQKIVIHPGYKDTWKDDLALIKLSKPVKVSKQIRPITLAATLPKEGAKTVVSGYGSTSYLFFRSDGKLREASIPFIPYKMCKRKYQSTQEAFTSKNFCASKPGVGACPLDWGDPLVYNNKLIGIFSGSLGGCGSAKYPGVYCDLTQYRKWIKETTKH